MADVTTEGLEVEELVADEHDTHLDEHEAHAEEGGTPIPRSRATGWPCQQRRKGRSAELPAPQRYLDLPDLDERAGAAPRRRRRNRLGRRRPIPAVISRSGGRAP